MFISAGKKQMDDLAAKGLIVPETRVNLLGNELVLVVAKEKKGKIGNFPDLVGSFACIVYSLLICGNGPGVDRAASR